MGYQVSTETTSVENSSPLADVAIVPSLDEALVSTGMSPSHQQGEMPFAVVQGKELTTMPKDLYIPPDALEVILEAFEGPLDLLLYLIRRHLCKA